MSFLKLDLGILDSSLWVEDAEVRVVFLTMLAMVDPSGLCASTAPGIARRANLPLDRVRTALVVLEAPDAESRTLDHEGRRVERVDGGYRVLNYLKYQRKDHTAAARMRRYRARRRETVTPSRRHVTRNVTHVDVDVDVEEEKTKTGARASDPADFETFWKAYPRKVGKRAALAAWKALNGTCPTVEALVASVKAHAESEEWKADGGRFIPHPATFLRQGRWEDELDSPAVAVADDGPPERRQYLAEAVAHAQDPAWPEYESAVLAGEIPVGFDAFLQRRGAS